MNRNEVIVKLLVEGQNLIWDIIVNYSDFSRGGGDTFLMTKDLVFIMKRLIHQASCHREPRQQHCNLVQLYNSW